MSDVLQDAEAILNKAWHYPEDAYAAFELLPELVAEIKRLRDAAKNGNALVEDLMGNCNQLRTRRWKAEGDCKRWQQIAIEERADHIAAMHVLTGMVPIRSIPATVATVGDHAAGFRERAAKELGLQIEQEASYVKRLEEKISDFYECDATRRGCCRQVAQDQARAALAKIREGKE